jgi:hypothetical protein
MTCEIIGIRLWCSLCRGSLERELGSIRAVHASSHSRLVSPLMTFVPPAVCLFSLNRRSSFDSLVIVELQLFAGRR